MEPDSASLGTKALQKAGYCPWQKLLQTTAAGIFWQDQAGGHLPADGQMLAGEQMQAGGEMLAQQAGRQILAEGQTQVGGQWQAGWQMLARGASGNMPTGMQIQAGGPRTDVGRPCG